MTKPIYYFIRHICTFIILVFAAMFLGCNSTKEYNIEGLTQGSTYSIKYFSLSNENLKPAIDSILKAIDNSVSIYNKNSIISRINNNDTLVTVDSIFIDVFNKSQDVSIKTNGAFDVTVAPLVNAWGFGFKNKAKISKSFIDSVLCFVNYKLVSIEKNKLIKKDSRISLDFNAIAQGYSVDLVAQFFKKKNISNYLIEIGGEVLAKGKKDDGNLWRIGIEKPNFNEDSEQKIQAIALLENKALATSGNYRKFYVENGIRYSHSIDPATGYPVKHSLLSTSVIANDCATADAYATAFMVMGFEKSLEFLQNNKFLDAYFIYSKPNGDFDIFVTEGMNKIIEPNK